MSYTFIPVSETNHDAIIEHLNVWHAQGWDLVSASHARVENFVEHYFYWSRSE